MPNFAESTIKDLHRFRFNSDLIRDIEDVMMQYAGKISFAEAIGSIDILKQQMIVEQLKISDSLVE